MTEEELQKRLVFNIKAARKKIGFSQERLADKADISRQMMNDIEGGRRFLSRTTMVKLADALGIDVCELFLPNGDGLGQLENVYKQIKRSAFTEIRAELEITLDKIDAKLS